MRRTALKTLPAQDPGHPPLAPAPTAVDCLRCQLVGRRRLLCSQADACKAVPHVFVLGPLLLAGWAVTVVAFLLAVW